ncbi:MAG: PAC2 family protein [Anaerolineales bacterium]|jgi:predicted ATP-grasp superfamily ATP-dependent carboligase
MSDLFNIWEKPEADEIYMLAGWHQWADGGSISSGLPRYMAELHNARKIGEIKPDGYYLFQLPGAQQFLRPLVRHNDGVTESLATPSNEFYYAEIGDKGIVFFIGDEPHMDAERYARAFLEAAKALKVTRIVQFGGVFAMVPYDRTRHVHGIVSLPHLREELDDLVVEPSNYQGPTSIGSYINKRAGEQGIENVGLYAFSPIYQFGGVEETNKSIHIENDYTAWLNVMERVNHMLGLGIDLSDLETLSGDLVDKVDDKVIELDHKYPELRIEEFFRRLRGEFEEKTFNPLDDIWQDSLRRLGDEFFPPDEDE